MSRNRYAARIDANQPEIVKQLRELGYSVELNHDDILVGIDGVTYWYEIKTSAKAQVKPSQIKLLDNWQGHYKIVWSLEMILADIKKNEKKRD